MSTRASNRSSFLSTIPLVIGLLIISLFGLGGAAMSAAADDQLPDNQLTSADLGVVMILISSDTVVHTPEGVLAGSTGVDAFVASLSADHPNAEFVVTGFQTIGSLVIVDWHGEEEGIVVFPGRTVVTIENGEIANVQFLNLSNVSPVQGEHSLVPVTAISYATGLAGGYYPIVDELGNTIVPEMLPSS